MDILLQARQYMPQIAYPCGLSSSSVVKEEYQIIDNANKVVKHGKQLRKCRDYISAIESGHVSINIINEAVIFSNNTYEDILGDDLGIAIANTSTPRNIDIIENLFLNLKALEKMLFELMEKEADDINKNLQKIKKVTQF